MKKIMFIINDLDTGGAEIALLKLLQHIDRNIFVPYVVSLTTAGKIADQIHLLGISILPLGLKRFFPNPFCLIKLFRYIKVIKPDLVHTWMYHSDLLGGIVATLSGTPRICWCLRHSDLSLKKNKYKTFFVIKLCALLSYRIPAAIVSCSHKAKDAHIKKGYCSSKIHVIPNGFDPDYFTPNLQAYSEMRRQLNLDQDTLVVGLIARYHPVKNHAGFIEAAKKIHHHLPKVHFLVAGTNCDKNNSMLLKMIKETHLTDYIHLLGEYKNIPHLMAALDVLALASFTEAFPNVLGEAMACRVPCVTTDVGDAAKIVGESGYIVKPGDMDDLADKLVKMLSLSQAERRKTGEVGRERIIKYYHVHNIAKQYENLYFSILHTKQS
ncbi:MAG: glycosyltransferase, WbnK-like family [Gammaproteobacteria bacterium]|jgi:glycosyltransferase involved in cell wall biosynthesis|nr:glycosyltransferase, WbnK-like family [Gammaproteobacteria bacterium]